MKVIVVEDDSLYRNLVQKILKKKGYQVEAYANGDEAIRAIRSSDFDLLVTDMVMPGTEGIELIAEIKDCRPQIKVLAVSGSGSVGRSTYLALAKAHGADAILEKPFSPDQLCEKIDAFTG